MFMEFWLQYCSKFWQDFSKLTVHVSFHEMWTADLIFFQLVIIQSVGELLVKNYEKQWKSFLFINLAVEREEWSNNSQLCVVNSKLKQHERKWNWATCAFFVCSLLLHFCKSHPIFVVTICNIVLNHKEFKEGCSSKVSLCNLIDKGNT